MSQLCTDITHNHLKFSGHLQDAYKRVVASTILTERDTILRDEILVQIIDIYDIGTSKYRQLQRIDQTQSSNTDKLRTRFPTAEDNSDEPLNASLHKLVIQDSSGTLIYAIEYKKIPELSHETLLGCKLLLKNTKFQRGVALLEPASVQVLGGSIASMNVDRTHNYYSRLSVDLKAL